MQKFYSSFVFFGLRTYILQMKRSLIFSLLASVCFYSIPSSTQAQYVKFKRLTTQNGLSQNVVLSTLKDKQGFLWFGTMSGLNRYDGYRFVAFANDPQDSASLSNDWINCLCASQTGDIWIGTQAGGLNRYEYSTGKFYSYRKSTNDSIGLSDNSITSLYEDKSGLLWIGTLKGGICWKKSSENAIHRFINKSRYSVEMGKAGISTFKEDSYGDFWIGTSTGIYKWPRGKKFENDLIRYTIPINRLHQNGRYGMVTSFCEDQQGTLFIGVVGGLYFYDRKMDTIKVFTVGEKSRRNFDYYISCLLMDRTGKLWAGTADSGLFRIDREKEIYQHTLSTSTDLNSLSSNVIYSLCEDDAGGLWYGTYEGISNYNPRQKPFYNYLYKTDNSDGLSYGLILDIRKDAEGGLWFATHGGGLNYLPKGSQRYWHFKHKASDPTSLSSDVLTCMSGNTKDILWIGGRECGLMMFDKKSKRTRTFFHNSNDSSSLGDNSIFYLYEDHAGNVWIGTDDSGVDKLDPSTGKFVHYRGRYGDSTSLSSNAIWAILEDSQGSIWIGTQRGGLNKLDPHSGKCIQYVNKPGDPQSIPCNSICALFEYPRGILWIGTMGGGLIRFDMHTQKFTVFTKKDGLASNDVCSILLDSRGRLWLTTSGIDMFEPLSGKVKNFSAGDGIQCGSLNQEAACIGSDGKMYFGGKDGYIVFHPDSIYDNTYIPPVVLTEFKVFENSRPILADTMEGIQLTYEENYFSFEFAALSFTAPERNAYRYILEGFDKNWISCGTRRYAAYTHVDPGDYVFKVQGSNEDGVWNTKGLSIAVRIVPPYWRTWWFRISVITIILFVITFIIRRRFKFLEQRTKDQQELSRQLLESQENERKRIGIGLHDSLGQNLLVMKNLAVIGLEVSQKSKSTDVQLGEISHLASQALAEVREISYNLRPHHLDQLGLTGALKSIISRISASSQLNIHDDLDDVNNLFPQQEEINVFRIVQESVNNILKHSRATEATITVKRNSDHVTVDISDNGCGFDHRKQGFGLTGMAERTRILGGTLEVKSFVGTGTTIHVVIPVKEKND
jgi:signal transduction histidine kinase/ligand-binding sensor domain-containing protein